MLNYFSEIADDLEGSLADELSGECAEP